MKKNTSVARTGSRELEAVQNGCAANAEVKKNNLNKFSITFFHTAH